jgi:hypothetical protein
MALIEGVHARIHEKLGGKDGCTPHALFGHAADYKPDGDKGVLQFIVTISDGVNRGRRRTVRHNWRESSDSGAVATTLLSAYEELRSSDTCSGCHTKT